MSMHTGENEQALTKMLDMTRLISISLLSLTLPFQKSSTSQYRPGLPSDFEKNVVSQLLSTLFIGFIGWYIFVVCHS